MSDKLSLTLPNARRLYSAKKYQEALDLIEDNLTEEELESPRPYLSFFEGECYEKLGDHRMAMECFRTAYLSSLAF